MWSAWHGRNRPATLPCSVLGAVLGARCSVAAGGGDTGTFLALRAAPSLRPCMMGTCAFWVHAALAVF